MVVLDTLGDAVGLLRRHPKLLAYLVAIAMVGNVLNSAEIFGFSEGAQLLLGGLSLVVGPAIAVGVAGLVNTAAAEDRVSGDAFVASVIENYLPWIAALVLLVIAGVVGAFAFFVAFQIPLVNLLAGLAFFVLAVAAGVTLQFVDLAIVVDDEGAVEGIKRSYEVATANLGAVVGYSLLEVVVTIAVVIPIVVAMLGTGWPEEQVALEPTPGLLAALALAVLGTAVLQTWRVTFYRAISDRRSAEVR